MIKSASMPLNKPDEIPQFSREVVPANFLSRGLLSRPWRKSTFKKVMLKLKEELQIVLQLHL